MTKVESLMDSVYLGMEEMMRQASKQSTQGLSLSPDQQRVLDALPGKFVAVMREEMSWQKMKPQYVQLYCETFEQEEVDGMLAFYASPAGQALIDKMPALMQKSMDLSQFLLQSVTPRMLTAIKNTLREADVSHEK
ncbi:MAG: DUF2059 domain-containing protein [Zoogloeaceae bacterium]|nr:DUF2059 domain-containing protein [Zoogloeaceae bacterium]